MSVTDDLLHNAGSYAAAFDQGQLPMPPAHHLAIVACMDARLNPYGLLGLKEGDAHVIRNAGGVVTDDEIRSLAISQRLLGTEEIVLIHHTDCGMLTFTDDEFKRSVQDDVGIKPEWAAEAFPDLEEDVRQSVARERTSSGWELEFVIATLACSAPPNGALNSSTIGSMLIDRFSACALTGATSIAIRTKAENRIVFIILMTPSVK